jgi:hypothetical protein
MDLFGIDGENKGVNGYLNQAYQIKSYTMGTKNIVKPMADLLLLVPGIRTTL